MILLVYHRSVSEIIFKKQLKYLLRKPCKNIEVSDKILKFSKFIARCQSS